MVLQGQINVKTAYLQVKDEYGQLDFRSVQQMISVAGTTKLATNEDFINAEILQELKFTLDGKKKLKLKEKSLKNNFPDDVVQQCFEVSLAPGQSVAYILSLQVEDFKAICREWGPLGFKKDFALLENILYRRNTNFYRRGGYSPPK